MEVMRKNKFIFLKWSLLSLVFCGLCACASSDASRGAANQVDSVYQGSATALSHLDDNNLAEAYPNASPVMQGAMVGGTLGAATGLGVAGVSGMLTGAVGGAMAGGVINGYLGHRGATTIDQLENHGAKVFVLGDQVMIVIPSAQLFRGMTPQIYPGAYGTLNAVAKLLRTYTSMSIKVAAYTDGVGPERINQTITEQQAGSVVKYLWPRINTRMITAAGYGNAHLVEKIGGAANYRIEITLEKLPV